MKKALSNRSAAVLASLCLVGLILFSTNAKADAQAGAVATASPADIPLAELVAGVPTAGALPFGGVVGAIACCSS